MKKGSKPITILMADDDQDDCLLVKEAFSENNFEDEIRFVADGEDLMDYLYRRGKFAEPASAPLPDLILLDLNMPRKDGREALREIKSSRDFRHIPIIVLTTSHEQDDIIRSYRVGANSFITKPSSFEELLTLVEHLGRYWIEIVELPREKANG